MNLNCSDQLNQSPSSTPHIRLNGAYILLVRFRHLFRISFASPSAIFKKMLIPLPDSVVLVHAVAMATGPASLQTAKRQSIISQDGGYAFSIKKRGGGMRNLSSPKCAGRTSPIPETDTCTNSFRP